MNLSIGQQEQWQSRTNKGIEIIKDTGRDNEAHYEMLLLMTMMIL
jgi:hypothetical protein